MNLMQEEIHEINPGFIAYRFQLCRTFKSLWLSKRLMLDVYKSGKLFNSITVHYYMRDRPTLLHAVEYLNYKSIPIK